ncbi:MAG: hypothetical protein PHV32_15170, partial [Eubacteriales bacterium]|nr:hypothetical protein [Eubacteriales bacterium]
SWTSYGARAGTIDLTKYAVPLRSTAYFVRCSTRVYTIILTRPRPHKGLNDLTPAKVAGLSLSEKEKRKLLLIA